MSNESGQSEELNQQGGNPNPAGEVDENGNPKVADGATSGDGQGGEGEGNNGQGQSKSKNQKQRLRRKLDESEARNAQLVEDNRKLNEKFDTLSTDVDKLKNPLPERPRRVDFDTEEEYEDDLHNWRKLEAAAKAPPDNSNAGTQQGDNGQQGNQGQPAARTGVTQEIADNWHDACDAAAEKYDDFDAAINSHQEVTDSMAGIIVETENNAEVAYFLGKNPAEASRIAKLSVVQQVNEIQKLAGKFTNITTNAPEPINPEPGSDTFAGKDPEKMSPEEYRDYRRELGKKH